MGPSPYERFAAFPKRSFLDFFSVRDRNNWNRGTSKPHIEGRKGRLSRSILKRRRLRDIAALSRRVNFRIAKAA